MGLNNAVDQGTPNQAYVGPNYVNHATGGAVIIHRKGVVTQLVLDLGITPGSPPATPAQTSNLTLSFGVPNLVTSVDVWLPGDIVYISIVTRTGAFTTTVTNFGNAVLSTWAALLANGGAYVFQGQDVAQLAATPPSGAPNNQTSAANVAAGTGDFIALNPGVSTT
jgi:hypothetical protein